MRKISIKKVQQHQLEELQQELQNFIIDKNSLLFPLRNKDGYVEALMLMDIAQKIYYQFQQKIQRMHSKYTSLTLEAHQAAVLLQCLSDSQCVKPSQVAKRFITELYTALNNLAVPIYGNFNYLQLNIKNHH